VSKCIGADDNMNKFCRIESQPFVCANDAECGGFGKCINGDCLCEGNSDCTSEYGDTCVK
jgi:hypothetical protein